MRIGPTKSDSLKEMARLSPELKTTGKLLVLHTYCKLRLPIAATIDPSVLGDREDVGLVYSVILHGVSKSQGTICSGRQIMAIP